MTRDERVTLRLTDLPLTSVVSIFNFIQDFLERCAGDLDYFEKSLSKFSVLEQYFICEYISEYFSKNRIKEWLDFQVAKESIDDNVVRLTKENAQGIINAIDQMKASYKRRAQSYKKNYGNFKKLESEYIEELIDFKLPVYFKPIGVEQIEKTPLISFPTWKTLKNDIVNILKDSFNESDINDFIYNSFQFKKRKTPVYFLYINIGIKNKGTFLDLMSKVWENYNQYNYKLKEYKDYYIKELSSWEKQIESEKIERKVRDVNGFVLPKTIKIKYTDTNRLKFYPSVDKIKDLKKSFEIPMVQKKDFVKILYNAFPHIREEYFKKRSKNSDYTINQFFIDFSRKIRIKQKNNV